MKSVIKKTFIAQQHQHTLLHFFTYVEPESWEITIFLQNYGHVGQTRSAFRPLIILHDCHHQEQLKMNISF